MNRLVPTLSFATRLDRLGVPMWISHVLVTPVPAPVLTERVRACLGERGVPAY